MSGCVHIYCGDGKGKTTAAIGLAVRAVGYGKKVVIARFMKTDSSGEVVLLGDLPQVCLLPCEKTFGFSWNMEEGKRTEAGTYFSGLHEKAWMKALEESADMLVLDEIMAAINCGFVKREDLLGCLETRPDWLEVILTGRDPGPELLEVADYVSEICARKHPFENGMGAREGIEY